MVSGNLPTQLSLIAVCHSPGTGAFSLAHRPQETGQGSWAHRVTQTWVTSLFLTASGRGQVLTSLALAPRLAPGCPVSQSTGGSGSLLSRRWQVVFTPHANSNLLVVATWSSVLVILKFYPDLKEKISRLIIDDCRAEGYGKLCHPFWALSSWATRRIHRTWLSKKTSTELNS